MSGRNDRPGEPRSGRADWAPAPGRNQGPRRSGCHAAPDEEERDDSPSHAVTRKDSETGHEEGGDMKTSIRPRTAILLALVVFLCLVSCPQAQQLADVANTPPPLALQSRDVKIEIVDATFVRKLEGVSTKFEESQPDKFRGLVLTVKVKKPAGSGLTFVAQDFTLHYRYGQSSDVAKCFGLSSFSVDKNVDRPMSLWTHGIGRSSTGLATTKAETLFIDLFFQYMEPETSELHLLVAQPLAKSFQTSGWK